MPLQSLQSSFTYRSYAGTETYLFDVVVDGQGQTAVRNIRGPRGLIQDPNTQIPQSVVDDMVEARTLATQSLSFAEAFSGTVTFTGEAQRTVTVPPGVLNNANYRVVYAPPDPVQFRTESKTANSFVALAGVTYGTGTDPKVVPYSILVATAQTSTFSGTVTFIDTDAGSKFVNLGNALQTTDYRVVVSPNGFFLVQAVDKTRAGFTLRLGFTLPVGGTVTVGYDVFV